MAWSRRWQAWRVVGSVAALIGLLVVSSPAPSAQPAVEVTGEWVARQADARDTGRDSRLTMTMWLEDRLGRRRERTLSIATLQGTGAAGDRVLVRFQAPADIKGTGFLVWEHPAADDERFLYLPSLGRVRRIAGSEAQESFVGSDLSYEDIGGRQLDDYRYAMLDANAVWKDATGTAHSAWRIESRAKDRGARYPVVRSTIRKDCLVVVEAEVYNVRNEREKTYRVARLNRPDGIWTAMEATMANELTRTRTSLVVSDARYNVGLTAAAFSRRELEHGGR